MSAKPPFDASKIHAAFRRIRDEENLVQILPGVLMSEDSLAEMLTRDQKPEDLFRFLWDSGYGLEDTMRGEWSADERQTHSAAVARAAMLHLFRSRATRHWKSASCILVQRQDGTVEYPVLMHNELAPDPAPADGQSPEFLATFAAAERDARQTLAGRPKPRGALLLFVSRVRDGVAIRYQSLTENLTNIRPEEEQRLLHANHG